MKKICTFLLYCFAVTHIFAQVVPSDTVPAVIHHKTENGLTKFTSELRPLRAIAGAPAPFYTYFWEFGDGGFSFDENPTHVFNRDSAMVRLFATNNYDDGKRPPTRPKPIVRPPGAPKPAVTKPMLAANSNYQLFKMGGNIEMKTNCMPKPGDDMILVFGYRNKAENGQKSLNGTIAILYNDVEFSKNNFELAAVRTYHNEKAADLKPLLQTALYRKSQAPVYYASLANEFSMPMEKILLKDQAKGFKNQQSWKFNDLQQNEERFVFMHFKTTPEMLKDTNAVVRISGAFIPDHPLVETEFFTLELQIVASHDPNKMVLRKTRMNYRLTGKNRELTYKVRFQNTGKGPAKKIDVGVKVAEVFDASSIKVINTKPEVINCDSAYANQSCLKIVNRADSVHFVFSNIYLPGTQQKGVNDADSTQGFVAYKIKFKEKPPKLPIKSGAAIVFDKNEPIYTNSAIGRFKMGLSPGVIIGYGFPFETNNNNYTSQKNVVLGATLSPYASHRYYWQVELYFNSFKESNYSVPLLSTNTKDTLINGTRYPIVERQLYQTEKVATINVVPAQIRYNLNKYVGVGLGALLALDIYHRTNAELRYKLNAVSANGVATNIDFTRDAGTKHENFSDIRTSFFGDVQLGLVRVGPAIGFRYLYDPKTNANQMCTYVSWKF